MKKKSMNISFNVGICLKKIKNDDMSFCFVCIRNIGRCSLFMSLLVGMGLCFESKDKDLFVTLTKIKVRKYSEFDEQCLLENVRPGRREFVLDALNDDEWDLSVFFSRRIFN